MFYINLGLLQVIKSNFTLILPEWPGAVWNFVLWTNVYLERLICCVFVMVLTFTKIFGQLHMCKCTRVHHVGHLHHWSWWKGVLESVRDILGWGRIERKENQPRRGVGSLTAVNASPTVQPYTGFPGFSPAVQLVQIWECPWVYTSILSPTTSSLLLSFIECNAGHVAWLSQHSLGLVCLSYWTQWAKR